MEEQIKELYQLPNIGKYADADLLTLSETCAVLEEKVYAIAETLPDRKRLVIQEYISTRNDLEFEIYKTALRWGKHHYK